MKTSITLKPEQRKRLQHFADMLDTSRNAIVGMLIDNARLEQVTTTEVISMLPNEPTTQNQKEIEY